MKRSLLIILSLASIAGQACQWDTDCNPGSTCKSTGAFTPGICVGGIQPGEAAPTRWGWQQPETDTQGQQCSFHYQCGVGGVCIKARGAVLGVCR